MLFENLKRILKLDRPRLRGPNGARDELTLAATAQNLKKMAKLVPMPTRGLHKNLQTGARTITRNYCRSFSTKSTTNGPVGLLLRRPLIGIPPTSIGCTSAVSAIWSAQFTFRTAVLA